MEVNADIQYHSEERLETKNKPCFGPETLASKM